MPYKPTGRPPGRPRRSDADVLLRGGDHRRRPPGWKPSPRGKRNAHAAFTPQIPTTTPTPAPTSWAPLLPIGSYDPKPPHRWCHWPGAPACRNLPCRIVLDASGARYDEAVLTERTDLAHLFRRP
jgi:hypothetical protein